MVIQQKKAPATFHSLQRQFEQLHDERELNQHCQQASRSQLHRLIIVLTISASVLLGNIILIINLA